MVQSVCKQWFEEFIKVRLLDLCCVIVSRILAWVASVDYSLVLLLSWKLEQMLEQLNFMLGGCVSEGTQDSERIVAFN